MDWPLWILAGLCIWVGLAFALAPIIGRFLRGPQEFDSQNRERLGLIEADHAEREARVERAMARHEGRRAA